MFFFFKVLNQTRTAIVEVLFTATYTKALQLKLNRNGDDTSVDAGDGGATERYPVRRINRRKILSDQVHMNQ